MNVTLTLTTPEQPEPHKVIHVNVGSVQFDGEQSDMLPGVYIHKRDTVDRYDLRIVIAMEVTP